METFATLGDKLLKQYTTDFIAQMQGLTFAEVPTPLRCLECDANGSVVVDETEQGKIWQQCDACFGHKVPPIPYCELV